MAYMLLKLIIMLEYANVLYANCCVLKGTL